MMSTKRLATLLVVIVLFCAAARPAAAQNCGIIPTPQSITYTSGFFTWDHPVILFDTSVTNQEILASEYERLTGKTPKIVETVPSEGVRRTITFHKGCISEKTGKDDAYSLEINEMEVTISSSTDAGLFYGLQSLIQLYRFNYRAYFEDWQYVKIPCMKIVDYASYPYRGWMIDISRGPIPTMEYLKRQICTMAEFKLNTLTLYTEHTFVSEAFDYAPADGLTADQIRELQDYAKDFYIEIIGNQQCFAHFEKILSNPKYEYLADTKYNLNPALPKTYHFLKTLLKEETAAYNSPYFNINCDETEALGTGKAAKYVKRVGSAKAYTRHIIKLNDIVKHYGKKTMMWADIVLKDKEIQNNLPKDITLLVWSYVPSESFDVMISMIGITGRDYWVVPGVSMWSTVFPSMSSYEKNIANFARDGRRFGAQGLLNTAWNDSGEASLNSVWHAMAWGAEMSWKPTVQIEPEAADEERSKRLSTFDTNFNFQFFHFYNDENIIADFLRAVSRYEQSPIGELYTTSSLWNFNTWQFFPDNLTEEKMQDIKNERFNIFQTIELLKLILSEEAQYQNTEIIYNALYATNRMLTNLMLKRCQFHFYDLYQNPQKVNPKEKQGIDYDIEDLRFYINGLKENYLYLWDDCYRPYWRDTNAAKYDRLLREIETAPEHVFIETRQNDNKTELSLRTLFNDTPIHYTLDGTEPDTLSPVYQSPLPLTESCTVKTLTMSPSEGEVRNEKRVLIHKGAGRLAEVKGQYSTYRPEYSGGGKYALADGETGSDSYCDGKWQGYQGQDVELTYRWAEATDINSVTVRFLQNFHDWILAPTDIEVYVHEGNGYTLAAKQHFGVEQISGNRVGYVTMNNLTICTNDLKVIIRNPGKLPKEHQAPDHDSYIFLDEVIIN